MTAKALYLGCAAAAFCSVAHAADAEPHTPDGDVLVVTASPLAGEGDALAQPVSVLTGEELERQIRSTLGETLRREPGVSSTSFGAGASRPIIRGLGGDRVRTLVNGIGSIDAASASPDHATPIEPALAETIEVVRGTGLLRYGSSAAGGVVNVFDGRIASSVPEGGLDFAARAGVSTADAAGEASLGGQALLGTVGGISIVAAGTASWRDAEDYEIPVPAESEALRALEGEEHTDAAGEEDILENSFNEVASASAGLSFIGERGFLGFSVQDYASRYGVPGGHGHEEGDGAAAEEEEGGVFIDLEQTRYDLNGGIDLAGPFSRLDVFAGYADYTHTEFEAPGEPGTVFSNEGEEVRAELIQRERGSWHGAVGLQYRGRTFSAVGDEAFVVPTQTEQLGVYTFQKTDVGRLTFEGSARFETTEHSETEGSRARSFDGVSASVVGAYRASDLLGLNLSLFRTQRAPTTEELFSNGPHLATGSFDLGNPDLGLETALGGELGFRFETERLRLIVTGFYTDYDDFIYERDTGLSGADILISRGETDPEELAEFGELRALQFTGADAVFKGFEAEASAELGQVGGFALRSDLVADYVEAQRDEPGGEGTESLPRIPPLGVIAGLEADNGILSLRSEVEYAAEADDVAAFELPTDSYTLVNFYADWQVAEGVTLSASVLNAGEEEARLHSSFLKDEVPLPGRNLRFSIRYSF